MCTKVIPQRINLPIGSEVQILSLQWYLSNACSNGYVCVGMGFSPEMREYCGKVTKVVEYDEFTHTYELSIDSGKNRWSEEMFKKK